MDPRVEGATFTTEHPHVMLHEGFFFSASSYDTGITTLDFLITTSNKEPHLVIDLGADAKLVCQVYRNPTVSANGTAIPAINRMHDSPNVAATSVFRGPTVTATGTDIVERFMLGSTNNSGGTNRTEDEMDLAPNTKYLIRLTGTNVNIVTRLLWYELAD